LGPNGQPPPIRHHASRFTLHGTLPSIDHGRVAFFVRFWRTVEATPLWLHDVRQNVTAQARPREGRNVRARVYVHPRVNGRLPTHALDLSFR
jgi:hypothetical protein